ncbi:MAG: hypothetical protein GWP06_13955 [Actinobacteria bacterium]|nr:hypothetical protein [Actinomycetota bacterium]
MPPYGDMFHKGEVLLTYFQDKPGFFIRVENVERDRKKGWWRMTFLILAIPLQTLTWILDDDQMRGSDFTMGGQPMRVKRVAAPDTTFPQVEKEDVQENSKGRVVSMFDDE